MWVMDGASIAIVSWVTQKVWLVTTQVIIDWTLLLGWLIWSLISLRKMSQKTNKKTRIMNIVEENHQRPESQKSTQVTHLFDDLNNEN